MMGRGLNVYGVLEIFFVGWDLWKEGFRVFCFSGLNVCEEAVVVLGGAGI